MRKSELRIGFTGGVIYRLISMKKLERYGYCFKCGRLMPVKWLRPIELCEGHFAPGEIHHKLCCKGCKAKADQLGEVFEKDLKAENKNK